MGRVVHFEIASENPELASAFYNNVFSWNVKQWADKDYWFLYTGDEEHPGINGAIEMKKPYKQGVINTIEVDNIDNTIALIQENGGKILTEKTEIPSVGTFCYFQDPEANVFVAMQAYKRWDIGMIHI